LESAYGDLAATAEVSPFLGAVSTVGGMLWVSATAIALFSGRLLVRSQWVREGKFLIYFGLLSLLLAIDDIFQLHEKVLGQIPNLGQPLYLALYGGLALVFLYTQRGLIKGDHWLTFLAAIGFLAISAITDNLKDQSLHEILLGSVGAEKTFERFLYLLEDTAKLIGILLWLVYAVQKAAQFLRAVIGNPPAAANSSVADA
jgi:hypothetical protein